jgi:hypothetical protein
MATKKQKDQLIDRIKHGIKKFTFSMQRYGGETVIGSITPYQYHYWKNREQELTDYVMGFDREVYETEHNIPEEARMRNWYEIDNVAHVCGAPVESHNFLHIDESDQNGAPILNANGSYKMWEPIELSNESREKWGIQLEDGECIDVDHPSLENEYYFYGSTSNKGGWTTDAINIDGELDLSQLKIHYKQIEGSDIAYAISYGDGEPLSLQEDSSGNSQQCYVREGNMNEASMSKKLKKEIARAEAEAPQPDTDTVEEEDANELPEKSPEEQKEWDDWEKARMEAAQEAKKKKIKAKKTVKGKKQTKKKKEKK